MKNKNQRNQDNHQSQRSTIRYNDLNNYWQAYELQHS